MKSLMLKLIMVVMAVGVIMPATALADDTLNKDIHDVTCQNVDIAGCNGKTTLEGQGATQSFAQIIVDTILFAAGIISLIFLILGGIRYITSTGDSGRIQAAKDTILYAIIGLIVTFLAVPVAGYVFNALK